MPEMKTRIGKLFIKLVRKHFFKNNKYHKIFKLKTSKLSYHHSKHIVRSIQSGADTVNT